MHSRSGIEPGLELGGRYRLDEQIGAGGMGDVWRGVDLRLRRQVAVKILPAHLAANESAVERFRREAETTAGLQHPGITVTFDIDEHRDGNDRLIFLVMELLTGRDLGTVLARRSGGLPVEQAVSLAAQAADALAAAHSRGIVHRDIKPANLFLLDDGRVKLCDFGIARLNDATQLTASGNFVGTPLYMAPEQFRSGQLDARSDLYSLGCVLYELLLGGPPFPSVTNPAAIMYQHLNETPPPPRSRRPDVPEHVEHLTMALLSKDPAGRPPSASAVVAALRGSGIGTPQPASQPQELGTTADWAPPSQPPTGGGAPYGPVGAATRQDEPPSAAVGGSDVRRGRRKGVFIGIGAAVVALVAGGALALEYAPAGGHKPDPHPTRTAAIPTPGRTQETAPLTAGWQVTLAPQYGIAYDAPPTWKVDAPDYAVYFQDEKENVLAAEKGVAELDEGKCVRAVAGLQGGSQPVLKPTSDQLGVLQSAAADEARKWAAAAYGGGSTPPSQPEITAGQAGLITVGGISAARATVTVTPAPGGDACMPPHAVVETVAMAAGGSSSLGPVFFTIFADRNVAGQAPDAELNKIIESVRPYTCPPGTRPQKTNRCA